MADRYWCFNQWASTQAQRKVAQRIATDPTLFSHDVGVGGHTYAARSAEEAEAVHVRRGMVRPDRTWF